MLLLLPYIGKHRATYASRNKQVPLLLYYAAICCHMSTFVGIKGPPSLRANTRASTRVALPDIGAFPSSFVKRCFSSYAALCGNKGEAERESCASGESAAPLSLFVFCGSTNCR